MKRIPFLLLLIIIFTGCFVSAPEPIKDELLVNKTDSETQKLDAIEKTIVKISDEKRVVEKDYNITKQEIIVTEYEIALLGSEMKLLHEQQKLNTMKNADDRVKETKDALHKNTINTNYKNVELKYFEAKAEDLSAYIELKDAELALKVAERKVLQAKIARAYQDKVYGGEKKAPQGAKLINVDDYEKDYKAKEEKLKEKKEQRIKTETLLKSAELKLKNTEKI